MCERLSKAALYHLEDITYEIVSRELVTNEHQE